MSISPGIRDENKLALHTAIDSAIDAAFTANSRSLPIRTETIIKGVNHADF